MNRTLAANYRNVYNVGDINIYCNEKLCNKKVEILNNLFLNHKNVEMSEKLSEYYINSLETIKKVKQHILNNDILTKNSIVFYSCSEDYKYDLKQIVADVTMYVFDNIDDDLERDIDEIEIRNYSIELEDILNELLSHKDIENMVLNADYDD